MNKLAVFQELGIPSAYRHELSTQILRYQAWMAWSSVSRTSRLAPWMHLDTLDGWLGGRTLQMSFQVLVVLVVVVVAYA